MNNLVRYFTLFSVLFLSLFAVTTLFLGWTNPSFGEIGILVFAVLYCCALVPVSLLSAVWLIWTGRSLLSRTPIWLLVQIVFLISMAIYTSPFVGLFFSSLLLLMIPLLGFVDFLYADQKGYSLKFVGLGSVGIIWSILLIWRFKGDLLDVWISAITTGSNNLWLLNGLMCGFAWLVIAGMVSFLFELFRVFSKEYHAK